ncbi:MAG TPA: xanthine dehydrogenase family protein subunit M [Steroidobacteraceae bacterium]|jgi:xanthine dehydrogenase YagS FAD-binding subunit|nr:xanthine dehydrogenase family protein subunit M [Steroidobacteraceae bacterium]
MQVFEFSKARDVAHAVQLGAQPGAHYLGGGTNLLDLMKGGVERPRSVIDISELPLALVEPLPDGGLRLGALVRNSDAANHPLVRSRYPLLSQAFLAGASPQLRNMATVGGNLLQRTRCGYFTDLSFERCNKRLPGSGCAARDGNNRMHAILGASEACVATNPSDMSVALLALDAVVQVRRRNGARSIPIGHFHRLPGTTPERDTQLQPGELIVSVDLPPPGFAQHCCYLKVRDRASYAFALVSAAVALSLASDEVREARIVLGGVAHKPWRALEAENSLRGTRLAPEDIQAAARLATHDARALSDNAFKIPLAQQVVARALATAAGVT